MKYTQLGRTGLKVSRLCLGTMNFGEHTEERDACKIMDRALDHGINFFDTANVYGGRFGEGLTETIIGRWFAQGGQRREKVVLGTKVYGSMGDWPNMSRLSALNIRRACHASLQRLQTDYIDLFQMHHVDRDAPWDEIWQAMEQLVQEGKVLYAGSSNFAGWHIARACETAQRRNFLGLVSEQSLYNLLDRTVELEVLPACQAYGLGVLAWSPLAGGALAGSPKRRGSGRRTSERLRDRLEANRERLERLASCSEELDVMPATLALAWILSRPGVTGPIVGPRTIEQLDVALDALEPELGAEICTRLDEIFPGPGGPAPEAYAW